MSKPQSFKHPDSANPFIVGIGGLSSNVGKTTLLCDLLRMFPGWEAIKTTRGHYRSCGKDPHACCVSDLLNDTVVVRSGRESTYGANKDTGKYWDAGAANVHWVIATDVQVEPGVRIALDRVRSDSVFIEGNSFSKTVTPDFFIMVVRPDQVSIKSTARQAMSKVSAIYVSSELNSRAEQVVLDLTSKLESFDAATTPIFSPDSLSVLADRIFARKKTGNQLQLGVHLSPA